MTPVVAVADSPWVWEARPDVWLLVAAAALGYWWSLSRLRPQLPGPPDLPGRGVRARFAAGVVVLWVAVDWPMDRLGDDYLFSAHMVQFVMVTLVAAPLLVSGVPTWLQVELVRPVARVVRFLGRGPVALGLFQVVLVATHLPSVVELYTSNSLVHFSLHALWLLSGCLFWLPILGSEPVVEPLRPPLKIVYLIGATIVPTVPAGFLTWTETAFYDSYATAPRVWGISAVTDLQLAGVVMKIGGGTILWLFILWLFASWASEERSSSTSRTSAPVTDQAPTHRPDASCA
ncbi:MAG: cytochrome c oxidase assembly protein [Acidimicrobiales bacterium]|nr:cytochrome c oxidase assembly protein [Acidimicrobiales bacterium]GJM36705.1 MAG: hypothetical protein DHS20C19_00720 [Acidimicrobiales bacterium]